jgi:hypothetical protein
MLCQQCHDPGAPHDRSGAALVAGTTNTFNPAFGPTGLATAANPGLGGLGTIPRNAIASGGATDTRLTGRSCVDCHTEIHGSNSPAGARWHR